MNENIIDDNNEKLIINQSITQNDDETEEDNSKKLNIIKIMYLFGGISSSSWGRFGQVYFTEHGYNSF